MPSLGLNLNFGSSSSLVFNTSSGGSSYTSNLILNKNSYQETLFSFSSIPNYNTIVDVNNSYSLNLTGALARKSRGFVSDITTINVLIYNGSNFVGPSISWNRVYLTKIGTEYKADLYKLVLAGTDSKGNNYYDQVLETTWVLSWNGSAWQLTGKPVVGATTQTLKVYSGGSDIELPPSGGINQFTFDYTIPTSNSFVDINMIGDGNNVYFKGINSNQVYKSKTGATGTIFQGGNTKINFNFTQEGLNTGTPSVLVTFVNSYRNLMAGLFTFIGGYVHLPKESYSSTPFTLSTDGELSNLTSNALSSLSQTSTTLTSSDYNSKAYDIEASLTENTNSSSRLISISGVKNYDSTSFTTNSDVYQCGTSQPSPHISISSNTTTPRNFYLTHTGNTLSTRTQGENEGLALWDSTKKLWAIPKMGQYIRYYGGKYEFINISGTTIQTSSSAPWLSSSNACSPSVMPWNAVWNGNINVSKHYFDAMQKPTTLQINGTIRFPYSGDSAINYPIKSSQRQIGQQGFIYNDFVCGQYRKLVFKGRQGGVYYGSSGVDMVYRYSENTWFLNIYEYISDGKGGSYGDNFSYSASYSTSFPITFTYIGSGNGTTNLNSSTLVVSKVTSTNFDDVYTLADASYPVTIPVDTAFSSIW
jgi:hypothetical protein